jgi:hypothetical protein
MLAAGVEELIGQVLTLALVVVAEVVQEVRYPHEMELVEPLILEAAAVVLEGLQEEAAQAAQAS